MKLGIVGSEAAKFTPATELLAKELIKKQIVQYNAGEIVSGGCHLGGIDIWAKEIGLDFGLKVTEFLPIQQNWTYYKHRNLLIANHSDRVICITVSELPSTYTGMRFPYCYHCMTDKHVKSGGCWTVKKAKELHKDTEIFVV